MKRERPADSGASGTTQDGGDRSAQYNTGAAANTARPSIGDIVNVPGIGRCHVIRDDDPSLLTVQNAQGVEFRVGDRAVERLEVPR